MRGRIPLFWNACRTEILSTHLSTLGTVTLVVGIRNDERRYRVSIYRVKSQRATFGFIHKASAIRMYDMFVAALTGKRYVDK